MGACSRTVVCGPQSQGSGKAMAPGARSPKAGLHRRPRAGLVFSRQMVLSPCYYLSIQQTRVPSGYQGWGCKDESLPRRHSQVTKETLFSHCCDMNVSPKIHVLKP